ncbi:hypothetical protein LY78DRAFT_398082 [Colletotrichum sublineola]|nr:hypothetical protein LY78DRAFT_398082 [Colletotrichum sublineola]
MVDLTFRSCKTAGLSAACFAMPVIFRPSLCYLCVFSAVCDPTHASAGGMLTKAAARTVTSLAIGQVTTLTKTFKHILESYVLLYLFVYLPFFLFFCPFFSLQELAVRP